MELKKRVLDLGINLGKDAPISIQGKRFIYDLSLEPLRDTCRHIVGIIGANLSVTNQSGRQPQD